LALKLERGCLLWPAIPTASQKGLEVLSKEYDRSLRVEEIAREQGMSASGFQHRFKTVTDMSPIQF